MEHSVWFDGDLQPKNVMPLASWTVNPEPLIVNFEPQSFVPSLDAALRDPWSKGLVRKPIRVLLELRVKLTMPQIPIPFLLCFLTLERLRDLPLSGASEWRLREAPHRSELPSIFQSRNRAKK